VSKGTGAIGSSVFSILGGALIDALSMISVALTALPNIGFDDVFRGFHFCNEASWLSLGLEPLWFGESTSPD